MEVVPCDNTFTWYGELCKRVKPLIPPWHVDSTSESIVKFRCLDFDPENYAPTLEDLHQLSVEELREKATDYRVSGWSPRGTNRDTLITGIYGAMNVHKLQRYVDTMDKYVNALERCYEARETHYRACIRDKKTEDPGHEYWRIETAKVLDDCKRKLDRWRAEYEVEWGRHLRTWDDVSAEERHEMTKQTLRIQDRPTVESTLRKMERMEVKPSREELERVREQELAEALRRKQEDLEFLEQVAETTPSPPKSFDMKAHTERLKNFMIQMDKEKDSSKRADLLKEYDENFPSYFYLIEEDFKSKEEMNALGTFIVRNATTNNKDIWIPIFLGFTIFPTMTTKVDYDNFFKKTPYEARKRKHVYNHLYFSSIFVQAYLYKAAKLKNPKWNTELFSYIVGSLGRKWTTNVYHGLKNNEREPYTLLTPEARLYFIRFLGFFAYYHAAHFEKAVKYAYGELPEDCVSIRDALNKYDAYMVPSTLEPIEKMPILKPPNEEWINEIKQAVREFC